MIQYRIVKTPADVDLVVSVVAEMYTQVGYINPTKEIDLTTHTYRERTDAVTVLAESEELAKGVGTISVITDQKAELPMDDVYHDKLMPLREQGLRLAEVRRFAVSSETMSAHTKHTGEEIEEATISVHLLGIAVKYALRQQCDYICFMIKKEHAPFYEALSCVRVGEERPCPAIDGKPVVGYLLDLQKIKEGTDIEQNNFLLKKVLSVEVAETFFD